MKGEMDTLYLDIETDEDELVAAGFAFGDADVTVCAPDDSGISVLREALGTFEQNVVEHTKYDAKFLRRLGWDVKATVHDTQVMAWVLNENQPLDLESLVKRYLDRQMDKRIKRISGVPMFKLDDGSYVRVKDVPWDQMVRYNTDDVAELRDLYKSLRTRLKHKMLEGYWLVEEVPFTGVLLDMEAAGLPVDLQRSEVLRERLEVESEQYGRELLADASLPATFNLGSRDQLAAYLFTKRFRLHDRIPLDEWAMGALKSCLAGEHDDCPGAWTVNDGTAAPKEEWSHIVELLPEGFHLEKAGREYLDGYWQVRGLGLSVMALAPKCHEKECDHAEKGEPHKPSTSTPTLMTFHAQHAWVLELIKYRKLMKLLTTYLRPFPEVAVPTLVDLNGDPVSEHPPVGATGGYGRVRHRLFGRFNQTGTKTGRLSSSEPNLQNIPSRGKLGEEVRALFRGDLLVADYSQLEPRLLAHFSQDPVLLDVYRNNRDIYLVTAKALFGRDVGKDDPERDISKTAFLGTQYGAGPAKLVQIMALNGYPTTIDTAKDYLRELQRLYVVAYEWKDAVIRHVKDVGHVRTIGGRVRRLKRAFRDRKNYKAVGYGERQAVNAIIQGSAGDVVRRLMVRWPHYVEAGIHDALLMLAQVHDELVFEWLWPDAPEDARADALRGLQVAGEDGHGYDLDVPLVFEPHFGPSWAEAKGGVDVIELPEEDEDE